MNKTTILQIVPKIIINHKNLNSFNVFPFDRSFDFFPNVEKSHISEATYYRLFLEDYIKKDDFKGLVECLNVSLNKKRSKNINLVRWNQSGDIYTRFELEALKEVCNLNKD